MKTLPWFLVALLVVGIAWPAHGQGMSWQLQVTFSEIQSSLSRLESDVHSIKEALKMGYLTNRSDEIESLKGRISRIEEQKPEITSDSSLDGMRRRTVDTRISTLERKNDDLLGRIKDLEFGNELLRDRVKALEDSSTPRAKGKSPTSAR
jgi:chromosome segregation ATPase